jgi:hypothetical protein
VLTTIPGKFGIFPILKNGNKMGLSNLAPPLPNSISAAEVVAKTNGGMFVYGTAMTEGFYYYADYLPVYVNGTLYNGGIYEIPQDSVMFSDPQFYPSICVRYDGSVGCRWFQNRAALAAELPLCRYIMPAAHPLVYNGQSVFKNPLLYVDGALIFDATDEGTRDDHFNTSFGDYLSTLRRTLLGHKPDGAFVLVCTDSKMALNETAASLMLDLGCDYAFHMDGSSPVQMWIKQGFGAAGKVTSDDGTSVPNAIGVYWSFYKYDLNGDGVIDAQDVQLVRDNLGKSSSYSAIAARCDLNGDGVVDIMDLTIIMSVLEDQ